MTPRATSNPVVFGAALVAALVVSTAPPRSARACGVSAGGAAGLSGCSLEEHDEAARRKWRGGVGYAFSSTNLRFSGNRRVGQVRHGFVATLEHRPTPRLTLQAGLGGIGGSITAADETYGFTPGFLTMLAASWRVLDPESGGPFMLLTSQLSYASTTAAGSGYNALDLRVGTVFGVTIASMFTPYAAGRVFGGPILWRLDGAPTQGTDVNKYQVAAGLAVLVARRFDAFVEGVPLGERGFSAGAGVAF